MAEDREGVELQVAKLMGERVHPAFLCSSMVSLALGRPHLEWVEAEVESHQRTQLGHRGRKVLKLVERQVKEPGV